MEKKEDLDTPLNTSSVYQNFAELEQDPNKNPRTPISQYNYFVRVYNMECNTVDNIKFTPAEDSALVEALYPFKTKFHFFLRFLIPIGIQAAILILCILSSSLLWILLSGIAFILSFIFSGFMAIKMSGALEIAARNLAQVPHPLSQMIYSPILCKKKRMNAALYEVIERELNATGLSSAELDILRKRLVDGKVEFMAYNDTLLKWCQVFEKNNILSKMGWETAINFIGNFSLFLATCIAYIINT